MLYNVSWFYKLPDNGLKYLGNQIVTADSPADALAFTALPPGDRTQFVLGHPDIETWEGKDIIYTAERI